MAEPGRRARLERMGLGRRFTLAALLPLALFSVLAILVTAHGLRRTSVDLILQRNQTMAEMTAAYLTRDFTGYRQRLEAAAQILEANDPNPERQGQLLARLLPYLERFNGGVTLTNADGVAIANTPGGEYREGVGYGDRAYFQQVRQTDQPAFSTLLQDKVTGQEAVVIAVPVHREGIFEGALIGVLHLKHAQLAESLAITSPAPGSQAFLVDARGNVIFHPSTEHVGAAIHGEQAYMNLSLAGEPVSQMIASPFVGQETIASYAPLPGIGWGLIMEEPLSPLLRPTLPYRWAMITLLGLGMLVAFAVLFVSTRQVVRPIDALASMGRRVSRDGSFRPLELQGPPEVRTLTSVFNHMVLRLADQQGALHSYAAKILQSQEEERLRISRELHDETVQQLVGLSQRIELCRHELARDTGAAAKRLDELAQLTKQSIADVRRMSNDLRPFMLEDLGLLSALEALCHELSEEMPHAHVRCELIGKERELSPETDLIIFRVVQEALTNIRKHASTATEVSLCMQFEECGILITMKDNGPGFIIADGLGDWTHAGHLGLAGMQERARLLGGHLEIDSTPGHGTSVTLYMPLLIGAVPTP